jgi:hypothetical protein
LEKTDAPYHAVQARTRRAGNGACLDHCLAVSSTTVSMIAKVPTPTVTRLRGEHT